MMGNTSVVASDAVYSKLRSIVAVMVSSHMELLRTRISAWAIFQLGALVHENTNPSSQSNKTNTPE